MRHEISGGLTALALIVAILAAVGFLGSEFGAFDMFSHPRPLFVLILAALCVLLLIVRAWRRAAASLIAAIALAATIAIDIRETQPDPAEVTGPSFTLLSFNVLWFNRRGAEIVDMIEERHPDVAVILEAQALFDQMDRLQALYPHLSGCETLPQCDLLVLSRLPVDDVRRSGLIYGQPRMAVVSFTLDGTAANVVGIHLSKPYHDNAQWVDTDMVSRGLRDVEGPTVLAGDFNAVPWSYIYARLIGGHGFGAPGGYRSTWPASFGAYGMPIDHIAVRDGAVVTAIAPLEDALGSNHRGLWAEVRLPAADPSAEPDTQPVEDQQPPADDPDAPQAPDTTQ